MSPVVETCLVHFRWLSRWFGELGKVYVTWSFLVVVWDGVRRNVYEGDVDLGLLSLGGKGHDVDGHIRALPNANNPVFIVRKSGHLCVKLSAR